MPLPLTVRATRGRAQSHLVVYNGKLYFKAYTYGFGNELWMSDGTEAGTEMVLNAREPGSGFAVRVTPYSNLPITRPSPRAWRRLV